MDEGISGTINLLAKLVPDELGNLMNFKMLLYKRLGAAQQIGNPCKCSSHLLCLLIYDNLYYILYVCDKLNVLCLDIVCEVIYAGHTCMKMVCI
ncbi:uncharacterized protein LOC104888321 [Beta vulgaris subsp. vulgaris]|uniref:uncharacterized protein LOC104888321 n=1 Tax=Beta vulgaris subsp. vulgaris TaxID=3555 RepID=UPI002549778C|nr:uncharacterized protein LOC104888321 [Beta vulgaris subsp. vulgaris]